MTGGCFLGNRRCQDSSILRLELCMFCDLYNGWDRSATPYEDPPKKRLKQWVFDLEVGWLYSGNCLCYVTFSQVVFLGQFLEYKK